MKCLFIGGPKAGEMIEVVPEFGRIQFQTLQSPISYDPRVITGDSGSHVIYVLEGSGDPLIQLMEFYSGSVRS